ncbi:leucyl aminopeptidase [Paenibacillus sp. DMB20]|uniref:leucyl aminopeptidase n=1 Tax=Paenibacillus sp. DMB20 TaxID=1642570 RepID=UPI0006275516|nr:leucyl aminopeptidase [Paenibacillus sp. DMB20]KKO52951.1 peptidase M17 [Paenibacillus sp. DMB20]KKO53570.1 peptidase M17 [Paenibacillus sp. DMB20]
MQWTLKSGITHDQADSDAHVVLVTKQQMKEGGASPQWDVFLKELNEKGLFQGAPERTYTLPVPTDGGFRMLILTGRTEGPMTSEQLRLAAAHSAKAAVKIGAKSVSLEVPVTMMQFTVEQDVEEAAQALAEGFLLGSYRAKQYKREQTEKNGLQEVRFFVEEELKDNEFNEAWERGIARGQAVAEATCLARDLTNLPGNLLVPDDLAQAAMSVAERHGMEGYVLNEEQIAEQGMGGLLAVGKGSVNPPRMIVIKYQGTDHWDHVIGLVGKGITFDTGGISLKKAAGMEEMISDMGGAATVLGVMEALGRLRPKLNVVMVIPAAENMPNGNAVKPGDVITTLSGRTIEILNTDAEGRVVLADGVTYAKELGASRIIDVATLTGAVLVALGNVATGAVTNDETFLQELVSSSRRAGEKVWPLPSYPEFWDMLKSDVADVKNSTGRLGGSITAGLFIGTFADGLPWVHFDIAGTAFLPKERGVDPKGATGVMVRTIADWILTQE